MASPRGLELHGSSWRVKKRVPSDLLRSYPDLYPSPTLSLNTGESDKRLAAVKAWQWLAQLEEEFQRVRETGSKHKQVLPDEVAELVIQKVIHSVLLADEEIRTGGVDDDLHRWLEADRIETDARERGVVARGHVDSTSLQMAFEWLYAEGFELAEDSAELRQFTIKLFRRLGEARSVIRLREGGQWVETPPKPTVGRSRAIPKLSEVIEYFISKQPTDQPMFKKYRPALGLFLEFVGDKPVDQLRQREIDDYFELLCRLPPRWPDAKRRTGMSVRELGAQDWPVCMSRKTFEDSYMAAFRPFLVDAVRVFQDQGFPGSLTIAGIKYSGKRGETENEQRAIRPQELKRLFEGSEYQSFALDADCQHFYWLPLLGLYTGARVNELCQLNPQCDIRQEEGVWLLDINEKSEGDARIKKTVKNTSSRRKVPVHSELIRLGFIDYVLAVREAGAKLLFPQWNPSGSGNASGIAERWFRGFLKATGLRDETPKARLVGFHAFRHTFLNYAMNNDVLYAEWLTGHVQEGVSRVVARYQGEAEVTRKVQILEAIRFEVSPPELVWRRRVAT